MHDVVDDKSEHCIPFILERLKAHRESHVNKGERPPPFFLGLNGVQGAGKTTLVSALSTTLSSPPYNVRTLVLSIDDLYLPYAEQHAHARAHPSNPLIQHRGQPSTHDIALGRQLFRSLDANEPSIAIPLYDKSAHGGAGDRWPRAQWPVVNENGSPVVEVVVFEGWCVGFRALEAESVTGKWREAKAEWAEKGDEGYKGQLGRHALSSALFVNDALREYDVLTERFDAFVHIDAEDPLYVYDWRLEQEAALRAEKGSGMTEKQVVDFVNGYYPAYELYTNVLRRGIFPGSKGKQLQMVVDRERRVKEVNTI